MNVEGVARMALRFQMREYFFCKFFLYSWGIDDAYEALLDIEQIALPSGCLIKMAELFQHIGLEGKTFVIDKEVENEANGSTNSN